MSETNRVDWISPLQTIDVVVGRSSIQHKCEWETFRNYDWNLVILVEKNGAVRIDGEFLPMKKGCFYLFAPTSKRRFFSTGSWTAYWAHFPLLVPMEWSKFALDGYCLVPSAIDFRRGKRDIMEAFQLAMGSQRGWHSLVLNLIQDVILRGNIQQAADLEDERLLKAEIILNDFEKSVNMEHVATLCGMSRSVFYSRFLERYGISPRAYRERGQFSMVRVLLESTSLTLAEIASRCGIHDMTQFFKRFKNVCGMTPVQYRKSVRPPAGGKNSRN